ncbi:MAG: ribosomal RNA small subunit methyltransferase A [Candidatus Marinimicrobia bacterium]|nr:ribosomal RNA small subunit methyltransferase A [Candidatus Neomarinimicrobiota bacterium]
MSPRNQGFRHKKRLGQNFMMDRNVAAKIVDASEIGENDVVLEIGPGMGSLTKELLSVAKNVTAVEIDERLVENLKVDFEDNDNFKIVHKDFLEFDISGFAAATGRKIKIVGNIPYNITSQILIHTFDHFSAVSSLTVTMQKEVADRILSNAGSKNYGILSVYAALFSHPKKLFNVSRGVFNPKPKVESSAVMFKIKNRLPDDLLDLDLFKKVVRKTFGKRRKMLRNSLKEIGECTEFLAENGFDLRRRPESLDVEEFIELSNAIHRWQKSDSDS